MLALGGVLLVFRQADVDLCVEVDHFLVESDDDLFWTVEVHPFSLCTRAYLRNIVQSEDHVL